MADAALKPRPPLPPGPYLVAGLARSGVAAGLALRARGEAVIGWDQGRPEDPALSQAAGRLSAAGVEVHLDASREALAAAVNRAGTLVKSPGVPQDAAVVQAARERGLPVIGELELAWRLLPNRFLAVTGTNGKTTTTEWIGHIYRQADLPVEVVGNVGTAASTLVGEIGPEPTVVCEASSFQLEDTEAFSPEAAVLLNLSPDHLDRHGSFEAYAAAKLRVFARQGPGDLAVLPAGCRLEIPGRARHVEFGHGPEAELAEQVVLPGRHNRENGMAAAAVCLAQGIESGAVAAGLRSFGGVAHRLETVRRQDGVTWINDSKATNVQSTIVALSALEDPVHLIAGGRGKRQDFSPLAGAVAERCAAVYLIGEAAGELDAALSGTGVPIRMCGELEPAVAAAHASARRGQIVLLSPACASFDQYADFEARGERFRELVSSL